MVVNVAVHKFGLAQFGAGVLPTRSIVCQAGRMMIIRDDAKEIEIELFTGRKFQKHIITAFYKVRIKSFSLHADQSPREK